MCCEQREHLLAEYRKAMADLTALAMRDRESTVQSFGGKDRQVDDAISAAAKARVDLREHVDEHRCWSHPVYSALFFLWRNQAEGTKALDERLTIAS